MLVPECISQILTLSQSELTFPTTSADSLGSLLISFSIFPADLIIVIGSATWQRWEIEIHFHSFSLAYTIHYHASWHSASDRYIHRCAQIYQIHEDRSRDYQIFTHVLTIIKNSEKGNSIIKERKVPILTDYRNLDQVKIQLPKIAKKFYFQIITQSIIKSRRRLQQPSEQQQSIQKQQEKMMDNAEKQIENRNNAHEQSQHEKQIQEDQSMKPQPKLMGLQNRILNNGFAVGKSRREIKIEREELTRLFYDLVFMINGKVNQAMGITQSQKQPNTVSTPNNTIPGNLKHIILNKEKSRNPRSKKQQQSKLFASGRLQDSQALSRKLSTQQQKLQTLKWQKQRKKQQILGNYSQKMKYFLHQESIDEQKSSIKIEIDKKWSRDHKNNFELSTVTLNMPSTQSQRQFMKNQSSRGKDKHFSVFQEVSLMISPPIPH